MLATLILGILAGAAAPHAEPHVRRALENVTLADPPATAGELKLFAFAVCLVGAAILSRLAGDGGGSALTLALGGAIGVFAPRIVARVQARGARRDDDD